MEVARLLHDCATGREHRRLTLDFEPDRSFNLAHGVDVLGLGARPEVADPLGFSDTLASTRIEPWCMCASETPRPR